MGRYRAPGMSDLQRRLRDIRSNQAAKRIVIHPSTELDELRAVKRLAYELFGSRGCVTCRPTVAGDPYDGGNIAIGIYLDPPELRRGPRPPRIGEKFRGANIAELLEQVRAWKAAR